jgi:2-dehydropantoate 2-reductase
MAASEPLVISFQNGISNVDVLEEMLGDRFQVVRGMVPYNVAFLGGGRFHKGVAGDLYAQDRPETRNLSERVGDGPARLRLSDDMLGIAWGKLLINLNNAVNALSGRPLIQQLRERDYRRVVAASQREGIGLLRRSGIKPAKIGAVGPGLLPTVIGSPDWLFNKVFLKAWKIDDRARSSMADDLAVGRKTEIDYINGELVRLSDSLGVDAPVNKAIVRLVREAEAGHRPVAGRRSKPRGAGLATSRRVGSGSPRQSGASGDCRPRFASGSLSNTALPRSLAWKTHQQPVATMGQLDLASGDPVNRDKGPDGRRHHSLERHSPSLPGFHPNRVLQARNRDQEVEPAGPASKARRVEGHVQLTRGRRLVFHELEVRAFGTGLLVKRTEFPLTVPVPFAALRRGAIFERVTEMSVRLQLQPSGHLHLADLVEPGQLGGCRGREPPPRRRGASSRQAPSARSR